LGSAWEALVVLYLLARGARAGAAAPGAVDWCPCPIVDPLSKARVGHRPQVCLILDGAFYFFQPSFATPKVFTVDALVWVDGRWVIWEEDGPGHDAAVDRQRDAALLLPVLHMTRQQIERGEF